MRRIILTAAVALIVTQIASMVFNNDIHQGGYCDPIARWIVEGALPKAAVAQEPGPGIITTFAGVGSFSGDGGPATEARLRSPIGVTVDADRNVLDTAPPPPPDDTAPPPPPDDTAPPPPPDDTAPPPPPDDTAPPPPPDDTAPPPPPDDTAPPPPPDDTAPPPPPDDTAPPPPPDDTAPPPPTQELIETLRDIQRAFGGDETIEQLDIDSFLEKLTNPDNREILQKNSPDGKITLAIVLRLLSEFGGVPTDDTQPPPRDDTQPPPRTDVGELLETLRDIQRAFGGDETIEQLDIDSFLEKLTNPDNREILQKNSPDGKITLAIVLRLLSEFGGVPTDDTQPPPRDDTQPPPRTDVGELLETLREIQRAFDGDETAELDIDSFLEKLSNPENQEVLKDNAPDGKITLAIVLRLLSEFGGVPTDDTQPPPRDDTQPPPRTDVGELLETLREIQRAFDGDETAELDIDSFLEKLSNPKNQEVLKDNAPDGKITLAIVLRLLREFGGPPPDDTHAPPSTDIGELLETLEEIQRAFDGDETAELDIDSFLEKLSNPENQEVLKDNAPDGKITLVLK